MKLLGLFFAVGIVAIFQMYAAVPLGLAGSLDRGSIIVAAWIGGMIGVIAFVYFGPVLAEWIARMLRWVLRRPPKSEEEKAAKEPGRVQRYAERWGEPFLGVVGPLTIGGWGAAVLGSSMGLSKGKMILWLGVGQAIVVVSYTWALKAATQ